MPRSSTPPVRLPQAISGQTLLPSAKLTTSAPIRISFEALSRSLQTPCVRFAAKVAVGPRNTRVRPVANLCRFGTLTLGSLRRFPQRLSLYIASPFTKLCLAQQLGDPRGCRPQVRANRPGVG